jgi:hypothetical protein
VFGALTAKLSPNGDLWLKSEEDHYKHRVYPKLVADQDLFSSPGQLAALQQDCENLKGKQTGRPNRSFFKR